MQKGIFTLKKTFLLLFILNIFNISAQNGTDNLGSWFALNGTNMISKKFSWHTEAQFRYFEFVDKFNQTLLRTGINYHFSKKSSVTAGYAYIDTAPYNRVNDLLKSTENRIYEQFILRNNLGKFSFRHRYRLEQRWISSSGSTSLFNRFRYNLQVTYPIADKWKLIVFDEIMINFEPDLFNQNRFFAGFAYIPTNYIAFQLGYLKNHFIDKNFDRISLTVAFKTDFIANALKKN
ncbi:DUF2490 domain-containing protein [Joostella sp.]|uniref:DUF2490 domain-containing protein n=1 Tax=Joostella sp. TaxID=2231138 RepID=UPI003A8E293C